MGWDVMGWDKIGLDDGGHNYVMIESDVNRGSTRWIDFTMNIAEQIQISGST
jgi:hypothetical protein